MDNPKRVSMLVACLLPLNVSSLALIQAVVGGFYGLTIYNFHMACDLCANVRLAVFISPDETSTRNMVVWSP